MSDFVSAERARYADDDDNRFAIGFSQISRNYGFLEVILKRYEEESRGLFENTKATQATLLPGSHRLTDAQMRLHEEGVQLNLLVHLEIESFYLFAKICPDRIAHALEFYFGQVRNKPLDSHDDSRLGRWLEPCAWNETVGAEQVASTAMLVSHFVTRIVGFFIGVCFVGLSLHRV
jgi:hypothetical protein